MTTHEALQRAMEFGHVIRVLSDGTLVENPPNAPQFLETATAGGDGLEGLEGWDALTGYTGQYGYNGPIMHASEYIGGRLARDILETPGYYVAVVVESSDYWDNPDSEPAGWAILRWYAP